MASILITINFESNNIDRVLFFIIIHFDMENKSFSSSLQLKLDLLRSLKEGNVHQSQQLLKQLSRTSHSHPELYQKFHSFIKQHQQQIIEDRQMQRQEDQPAIIVDTQSDGSWITDQSAQWSDEETQNVREDTQNIKEMAKSKPKLLKNIMNSKSAVHLKPAQQIKRPFYIQTKPKQNTLSSTINLRRESSKNQKVINLSELSANLSKTAHLTKVASKRSTKPYFPPINQLTKQNLKL